MSCNLRHIGITEVDMKKSLKLYRDIFNLKVVWDRIEEGKFIDKILGYDNINVRTVKLSDSNGFILELLQYFSHSREKNTDEPMRIGCSHFAITVESAESTYNDLRDFGLIFISEPTVSDDGKAVVAFCRDMNEVLIEIVEQV